MHINKNLAIAYSNNPTSISYKSIILACKETNSNIKILDQIISYDLKYDENKMLIDNKDENGILSLEAARIIKNNGWKNSNVESVMKDIDCVIIPGGVDISPTLLKNEKEGHNLKEDNDYSAERDISDYLLISYCLDLDIPILCICRGMQMLGVVSGSDVIQDIPTYFNEKDIAYDYIHRDYNRKYFLAHDIKISDKDSLLYKIYQKDIIKSCPSWHHQAIDKLEDTKLSITGIYNTSGIDIIEAIERKDKSFCLGVQFHPEIAVKKHLENDNNKDDFMNYEDSLVLFKALVNFNKKLGK